MNDSSWSVTTLQILTNFAVKSKSDASYPSNNQSVHPSAKFAAELHNSVAVNAFPSSFLMGDNYTVGGVFTDF